MKVEGKGGFLLHPAEFWYTSGSGTEILKFDDSSEDQSGRAGLCSSLGTVISTVHL